MSGAMAQTGNAWFASADDASALPRLVHGGGVAVSASPVFWGANWSWAGLALNGKVVKPGAYAASGKSAPLGLDWAVDAKKVSDRQMEWDFRFNATQDVNPAIGGGLVFAFDLENFAPEMGEPALLPGNQGWVWGKPGANQVQVTFAPALPKLYFEKNNKKELRAFFYDGAIAKGRQSYRMNLTLAGDMRVRASDAERFGLADPAGWPIDTLDWQAAPVDLSFLNAADKPAGKRGFVKAVGESLQFADGSTARLWGTNITAYALYGTPKEAVKLQAKRLSALGFNLVRLHHHDSPWVTPNVFGDTKTTSDTRRLNSQSLDALDWWIKCLKDEGIYVWLDMHVQRAFKRGDGIFAFDEMRKGKEEADLKGYSYVNFTVQNAMKRFNEAYVTHVNPYTGLAAKDEPAVAAMLITNENDVTNHFGNALLPDKKVPEHTRLYMAMADNFAKANDLPKDKVWRSWEHGPSKLFLNDLEKRFNDDLVGHLRSLGVKVPIATTSTWGDNPLSALPALTTGDLIDVHAYGGTGELEKNPQWVPGATDWMAAGQVLGKPMTVTEWNVSPFPAADRHTMPIQVAATASLQGWDALMQYAYTQQPANQAGSASNWHAHNDPALLATLPAAALMYRQGHVKEAQTRYVMDFGRALFDRNISAANSRALRTAALRGKVQIAMPQTRELPWLSPGTVAPGSTRVTFPGQALMPADALEATSDTGELMRNWGKGIYTVNTPRSQIVSGWLGSEVLALPELQARVSTANATVAVESLDNAPLAKATGLLISLGARAMSGAGGRVPFHVEPVLGELRVRAVPGLRLYKNINKPVELPAPYSQGWYTIRLDDKVRSNWLFLRSK